MNSKELKTAEVNKPVGELIMSLEEEGVVF